MISGAKEYRGAQSPYSNFFALGYTSSARKLGLEPEVDPDSSEFLPRIGSPEPRVDPSRPSCSFFIEPISVQMLEDRVANDREPNLAELFGQFYEPIFYWFLKRGVGREQARELAQDTFLSAAKGLATFRREASYKTWLFQIARNLYRNHLRERKTLKRDGIAVSIDTGIETDDSDSAPRELADRSVVSPEDGAIRNDENRRLYGALDQLPTKMRQCLELRLEGMKYAEIAGVMGISIETVKSHLHQARLRLREILDREPEGDR